MYFALKQKEWGGSILSYWSCNWQKQYYFIILCSCHLNLKMLKLKLLFSNLLSGDYLVEVHPALTSPSRIRERSATALRKITVNFLSGGCCHLVTGLPRVRYSGQTILLWKRQERPWKDVPASWTARMCSRPPGFQELSSPGAFTRVPEPALALLSGGQGTCVWESARTTPRALLRPE